MEILSRIFWRVDPPPPSLQSTVCVWPPPGTHARLFTTHPPGVLVRAIGATSLRSSRLDALALLLYSRATFSPSYLLFHPLFPLRFQFQWRLMVARLCLVQMGGGKIGRRSISYAAIGVRIQYELCHPVVDISPPN